MNSESYGFLFFMAHPSRFIAARFSCLCAFAILHLIFLTTALAQYPPETHAIPIPKIEDLPILPGPFQGTIESLKQYQCPDWFRDAKFGIWAHWGPQSVPGDGDWYAREMYDTGSDDYVDHLKVYGHPSQAGYKDILPLWKAEKWDPDHLLELYKAAGAHYFVAQAVHHDNFDNWNSKYHKWNSVNIGPHKDMIALWQKATLKQGLHFGVSEHLAASLKWFQTSHGMESSGPYAGKPYDGNNPAYWDLYHWPADPADLDWHSHDPHWIQEWYARIYNLIDQYKPDLLYSDGGMPYHEVGRRLVAQFYNENIIKNGGKLEAVYNCKDEKTVGPGRGEFTPGTCVQDMEKGGMHDIQPNPFQTDTSVGNWFYAKNDKFKSTGTIIHVLADTISKNGNLLLNVLQYPDGSLLPEMKTFLTEMAAWMKVNREAIFGTRPWVIYGEGPTEIKGGSLNEDFHFRATDIRFVTKGPDLYAITLGLPSGEVVIASLATGSPLVTGEPTDVTLLGESKPVTWTRTSAGLVIRLPAHLPCQDALSFRIRGFAAVTNLAPDVLTAFRDHLAIRPDLLPDADGAFKLPAESANLHGEKIYVEGTGDSSYVGGWKNPGESVSWNIKISRPGAYQVAVELATPDAGSEYTVEIAPAPGTPAAASDDSSQLEATTVSTGGLDDYRSFTLGTFSIKNGGELVVTVHPKSTAAPWAPINLRFVSLKPQSRDQSQR